MDYFQIRHFLDSMQNNSAVVQVGTQRHWLLEKYPNYLLIKGGIENYVM